MHKKLYARYMYPNNGYDYDKLLCKDNLILGNRYLVTYVSMGQSYTDISLEGFGNLSFNSVNFSFEDEAGNFYDIFADPKYNPYLKIKEKGR